jgi:hypothetical protein
LTPLFCRAEIFRDERRRVRGRERKALDRPLAGRTQLGLFRRGCLRRTAEKRDGPNLLLNLGCDKRIFLQSFEFSFRTPLRPIAGE